MLKYKSFMPVLFNETIGIVLAKLVRTIQIKSAIIITVIGCFKTATSILPLEKNSKNRYKNKITANISDGKEMDGPTPCPITKESGIKNMVVL